MCCCNLVKFVKFICLHFKCSIPRRHMTSFQRQYDVVRCCSTPYRHWNDVVCTGFASVSETLGVSSEWFDLIKHHLQYCLYHAVFQEPLLYLIPLHLAKQFCKCITNEGIRFKLYQIFAYRLLDKFNCRFFALFITFY